MNSFTGQDFSQMLTFVQPNFPECRELKTPVIVDRKIVRGGTLETGPFAIGQDACGRFFEIGSCMTEIRPGHRLKASNEKGKL